MGNNVEKEVNGAPRVEEFVYDHEYRTFPQTLRYRERIYDAREDNGSTCIYRMTAEHRMELPGPNYVEVDQEGRVIREWD